MLRLLGKIIRDFRYSGYAYSGPYCSVSSLSGDPETVRTDRRPEFTCRALEQWTFENSVELRVIQPSKPTQNVFIKRLAIVDTRLSE